MVLLAALVLATSPAEPSAPQPQRVTAERQAVAIVRILPGAQLRFAEIEKSSPERLTDTRIRTADGSTEPARLVEFQ